MAIASQLAFVETVAAFAAAVRDRRLTGDGMRRARAELIEHWQEIAAIDVDSAIARRAADLARSHELSGADAIHLASVLQVPGILVTWDRRLADAARSEAVPVVPDQG